MSLDSLPLPACGLRMEGIPIDRLSRLQLSNLLPPLLAASLLAGGMLGCAGTAWDRALDADTPQAYHRFIRKYPDSKYVVDAQEHIAFHKVKRRPTLAGFETFREEYPDSSLLADLRPLIEPQAFGAAQAAGTPEAFRAFADGFPEGEYAARARGDATYLEADGFAAQPEELRAFAAEHPESDFAAEAQRSLEALEAREGTQFRRVGLVVEIAPTTPEARRLIQAFAERAEDAYQNSGVELVVVPEIAPPDAPTVRLHIKHAEGLVKASVKAGEIAKAGALARTVVTLSASPDGPPIFERAFELRLAPHERIPNASMLFSSKEAKLYWDEFFVPIASWATSAAVRPPIELDKKVAAVDAVLGRVVALYSDGDFTLLSVADPQKPVVLARYDRESKIEHFGGVRIVGDKVVIFGQDGLEQVSFTAKGARPTATHSRASVGSVSALVPVDEGLLLASSKGLLLTKSDGSNPERIMRRIPHGLDALGETLVFTDGESVFVSTLGMLRQNRVIAQLRLGRTFKPERVRVVDTSAIVIGQAGVVIIDLRNPGRPRVVSKLARRYLGQVDDAMRIGDRIFLLGARGMQLLDPNDRHVVQVVDVEPRERVARTGRHMVVVGERELQVVDGLPFAAAAAEPAARP